MAFDPKEAVEFLQHVSDAESTNRVDAISDSKFRYGDQWNSADQQSRVLTGRPCLTINEVDAYCRQVTNMQRQQRPRIKVHPVDSLADPKIAEVLTGITRHVEVNSDADNAYDNAFDSAVTMGWGYWRVVTDYIRDDSFDQDIFIQQIENPFTVYFDNNSTLPDGSDAEKCLITDKLTLANFERMYPGAETQGFTGTMSGDTTSEWISKDDIRIAEYFTTERVKSKLVMLSDKTVTWADKLPPFEVLAQAGIEVVGDRESYRKKIMWHKVTAFEALESKEWAGRWIPVIPVYGSQVILDGKRKRFGMVRNSRDPQVMVNYWQTAVTESIALAPRAKWMMVEGQDEGHESEWNKANVSSMPVLRYKSTDIEGRPAPAPERIQPEPPPSGMIEASMAASSNLQKVMGMFDPATRTGGPMSGKALQGERGQSEMSNFHYYDNLTRSIKHTGRIILDLVPKIYDQERVMRIIGEDGKPDMVTLNQPEPQQDEQGQPKLDEAGAAVVKIMNDVTVGDYDVVMDTGPGFNTKRQEALESFTSLMAGPLGEEVSKIGGDLIVRLYDAPGMDALADRLAASNPMAQIDNKSEVPPQAQIMIKNLQSQLQQMQQQLQAAEQEIKTRQSIEQLRQDGATRRTMLQETGKAHSDQMWSEEERAQIASVEKTKMHDIAMRTQTSLDVEEIKGQIALLLAKMDERSREKVETDSDESATD